jgi:hypothetical protein
MGEINLPPGLFYRVGAVLAVFGAMRAVSLAGSRSPPRPERVFLVISTILNSR